MQFANINTLEIRDFLPTVLQLAGQTITGATIEHWKSLGWRQVTDIDSPADGYRVTQYGVQELSATTCKLTVVASVNIADEAAAAAAAILANQKLYAKALLDSGAEDIQRALRAFAVLTLQEINTLRTKAGLATYTWTQFVNALKAKIDEQT
jgi:hypothetical protein